MDLNTKWTSVESAWDALDRWVVGLIFWEGQLAYDIKWGRDTEQSQDGIDRATRMINCFLTGNFKKTAVDEMREFF